MVKARGTAYAVPLGNVSRILRLEAGQLERLGNQQVLRLGKQVLPAVRLEEALGVRHRAEDDLTEINPRQPVLVVDTGGQQAAILVDELLLAREVVVKSLGSLVRKVRGVTGATILGDGGIVLIVNTAELFEAQRGAALSSVRGANAARARQRQNGFDVLVVDDSVSVRRVLVNLFRNQGWRPEAARDGMEALEILQSGRRFDAVLLDMEMPRMDGYELLTLLRGQAQFANLPVVMLTSRAAEKHRKKAFELGATDFLVKPYQDEALIAVVHRVVDGAEALAG
jgi:chemosensory pili system protein ChpA (sensor histidine kinase/response regulator)